MHRDTAYIRQDDIDQALDNLCGDATVGDFIRDVTDPETLPVEQRLALALTRAIQRIDDLESRVLDLDCEIRNMKFGPQD